MNPPTSRRPPTGTTSIILGIRTRPTPLGLNRRLRASVRQTTLFSLASPDYFYVTYGEPHAARGRQMLAAHPELRALAGPFPASAVWTLGLVLAQCGLALLLGSRPWFVWLPCAYIIGATIDHALWALIHDCTHNLVFRTRTAN